MSVFIFVDLQIKIGITGLNRGLVQERDMRRGVSWVYARTNVDEAEAACCAVASILILHRVETTGPSLTGAFHEGEE